MLNRLRLPGTVRIPVLLATAGLVCAGLLAMLLQTPSGETEELSVVGHADADSSYEGVRYRVHDEQGKPQYAISTRQIDQYLDRRQADLRAPRLLWLEQELEGSWATALRGSLEDSNLLLTGSVEVFLQPAGQEQMLIHSHDLELDGTQQWLRSARSMTTLSRQATQIRGRHLDWKIAEGNGSLHQDVRARHHLDPEGPAEYASLLERLLAFSLPAAHAESRTDDILEVEADKIEWDTNRRKVLYQGSVQAYRGQRMRLESDHVTVSLGTDGSMDSLHAEGRNQFTQKLDSGNTLRAQAESIFYYPREQRIVLDRAVSLSDGRQEFSGNHLVYLIGEERISSEDSGKDDESGRIRIRIPLGNSNR